MAKHIIDSEGQWHFFTQLNTSNIKNKNGDEFLQIDGITLSRKEIEELEKRVEYEFMQSLSTN